MKLSTACVFVFGIQHPSTIRAQFSSLGFGSLYSPNADVQCNSKITTSVVLQRDLDCLCMNGPAVEVGGTGNTFDMNGHSITCNDFTETRDDTIGVGIKVTGKDNCIFGPGLVNETSTGIVLAGDGGHTVSRVSIQFTGDAGLKITLDANTVDKNYISDSIQEDEGGQSIVVAGGDWNVLTNNFITRTDGYSALAAYYSGYLLVEGNVITDTDNLAVNIVFVEKATIRNNQISDIGCIGVSVSVSYDIKIHGNDIADIQNACHGVYISSNTKLHIADNRIGFILNQGSGMYFSYSEDVTVERNIIQQTDKEGIRCRDCDHCMISQNTISHITDKGIRIESACENSMINDNIISQRTSQAPIANENGSGDTVTKNNVEGCITGTTTGTNNAFFNNVESGAPCPAIAPADAEDAEDDAETRDIDYRMNGDRIEDIISRAEKYGKLGRVETLLNKLPPEAADEYWATLDP